METEGITYKDVETMIAHHHFAAAIATLSGIVGLDPEDARAWSLLGQTYTESGHQPAAIAALMRAVLLDDESAPTCEALGVAWLRNGDLNTARTWFHRGLEAVPQLDEADSQQVRGSILRNLAMTMIMEGRLDESRFLLEEAVDASPRDLLTLHALSSQYINSRRYDDASPLVDRILAEPEAPEWIRESAEHGRNIIHGDE